jgi:Txe/YoeB family toxin of toxin-antitoxin system
MTVLSPPLLKDRKERRLTTKGSVQSSPSSPPVRATDQVKPKQLYKIHYSKKAKKDLEGLHQHPHILRAKMEMIKVLKEEPFARGRNFEKLRHTGEFSRRLDHHNRLVYTVDKDSLTVTVQAILGHYGE